MERNRVARICARLNSGNNTVVSDEVIHPEKYKALTAVERVLAIRARKIEAYRRSFVTKPETREVVASANTQSVRVPHSNKYSSESEARPALLLHNAFKPSYRVRKEKQLEKEIILKGHSNFCFEPIRPRISLKGLDVYVRSRVGGREEPGRRFERNKELRKGGRISLRTMPLLDPDFHEFDDNEFDMYQLAVAALFNARD